MLKFASHDDITWFYTSHPLEKVLFRLQQTAVVSVSTSIQPTTDTILHREDHHASQDDMHTQLFEILEANSPRGALPDVSKRLPVLRHTQIVAAGPTQLDISTLSERVDRNGTEEHPRKRRRVHPSEQAHASLPGRINLEYDSDDGRLTVPATGHHHDDHLSLSAVEPYEHSEETSAGNNTLHAERGRKRKLEESDDSTTSMSTHMVATTSLKTAEPVASSAGPVPNTTSAGNTDYEALFFPYRPKRPLDSSGDPDLDSLSGPEERIVVSYTRMPVKIYLKHKETFFSLYNKSIREDSRRSMTQWKRWAEHGFGLTFRVERIDRLFGMWKVMGLLDELL